MSTDLHDRRPSSPEEDAGPHEKPKSSISFTQVIGGALAAMTAAALGSRLSVAGTMVGAALASVVAAVAGAVYTASLRRTGQHVSAVLTRVRPGDETAPDGSATPASTTPAAGSTFVDDGTGWLLPDESTRVTLGRPDAQARPRTRAGIAWKPVLVAAALIFVVAVLALTGLELATGRTLSGGTGTTVGRVADPGAATSTPTSRATPTPSATASPSDSPTAGPSPTPAATPSGEATAAGPSTTPEAAPTATPVPTESPTAGSPEPSTAGSPTPEAGAVG